MMTQAWRSGDGRTELGQDKGQWLGLNNCGELITSKSVHDGSAATTKAAPERVQAEEGTLRGSRDGSTYSEEHRKNPRCSVKGQLRLRKNSACDRNLED